MIKTTPWKRWQKITFFRTRETISQKRDVCAWSTRLKNALGRSDNLFFKNWLRPVASLDNRGTRLTKTKSFEGCGRCGFVKWGVWCIFQQTVFSRKSIDSKKKLRKTSNFSLFLIKNTLQIWHLTKNHKFQKNRVCLTRSSSNSLFLKCILVFDARF